MMFYNIHILYMRWQAVGPSARGGIWPKVWTMGPELAARVNHARDTLKRYQTHAASLPVFLAVETLLTEMERVFAENEYLRDEVAALEIRCRQSAVGR